MMHDGKQRWDCAPSARLNYRVLSGADEALYCSLYVDAGVMRNIGRPLDDAAARRCFQQALRATHRREFSQRVIALIERSQSVPVGIFDIKRTHDDPAAADVGTMLLPWAQRRGYVPECLRALMTYAFAAEDLTEIRACARAGNTAVEKILNRLGFQHRGIDPGADGLPLTSWTLSRANWFSFGTDMH